MRIMLFLYSLLFLFSCHSGSQPGNAAGITAKAADSLVKFRTLEFIVNNKPCEALISEEFKNFSRKKDFPLSLFITINTVEKDSVGHPTAKEALVFKALENKILSRLLPGSCYVGQTTMDGFRDMMFYIPSGNQKKVNDILKDIKKEEPRIRVYTFENDPDWEAVSEFYDAMN